MNVVSTGDLSLEPQTAAHADEMYRILCDPAFYVHENQPPESPQALRERFARLESRQSGNGQELWLNWVVRLARNDLIGFVQATLRKDGRATIAYVFNSRYWGRGYARRAVEAMMSELAEHYGVRSFVAIFKQSNRRSRAFLEKLEFSAASPELKATYRIEADEVMMERAG
jgi:ribosomal-protein-alanine N-acetyltransferase